MGPAHPMTETVARRNDNWILLLSGIIMMVAGLVVGVCFFVGIILIVAYLILEVSKKPGKG